MSVMLNRARIARYTRFLPNYTPAATVSCRFPFLPAQLYNGNTRAGHVKLANFTPALFA